MKKYLVFFLIIILYSCNRSQDVIVAEVYNTKLYRSEIDDLLPEGLTVEDSTGMANRIIEDWIKEQVILHEANKALSLKEKNFDTELDNYRKTLLVDAYFKKLTSDTARFTVSQEEIRRFARQYDQNTPTDREIIKLNYVKLSPRSKVLKELKDILFDEEKRVTMKSRIEQICGDSLEYFIEDNTWLYLDNIQQELPINLKDEELRSEGPQYIETRDNQYVYLIVLLDYKANHSPMENPEYINSIRTLIIRQKQTEYIRHLTEELYQKALSEDRIIR